MENKTYKGYLANELFSGNKLATAREGQYYNGYTDMDFIHLDENVEGSNLLLHENLHAIIKHKKELEEGKRVNVHLEWELTEDRRDYKSVKVLNVEVTDKED